MPRVTTRIQLEVQTALLTAVTVTAVTKASPGVATAAAHGYSDGDYVVFTVPSGMQQLNGQVARVANSDTNTFELEGVDTTNFSTFTAGTCQKVDTWTSIGGATGLSLPDGAPTVLASTTLADEVPQSLYGIAGERNGSIPIFHERGNAGQIEIASASKSQSARVIRGTYATGEIVAFNAEYSYQRGYEGQLNTIETGTINFTFKGDKVEYAS